MEQTNAFEVLGATPSDNIESLQELLDEKELLSDDVAAVQSAYADLTNPKKRLVHEIIYLRAECFIEFKNLIFHQFDESPSVRGVAQILVDIGLWFDYDNDELFEDINTAREESGFIKLEDDSTLLEAINDLRTDCLQSANNYLDNIKENSLVLVFNQIVKIDEYESFFIDELIAHYELIISESLQKKENECRDSFNRIEDSCNAFNNGSPLSNYLITQISEFEQKLKSWDNYAQALQVNMQRRGGQHETSERLVCDLRNKVINLCNKSQAVLRRMFDCQNDALKQPDLFGVYNITRQIDNRLPYSLGLIEGLISIINIFQSVFAELDMTSETLAKDKKDLIELKKNLTLLNKSAQSEQRMRTQAQEAKEQASKNCRIAHGVFAIISLVIMIICFACGSVGGGVAIIFITGAFGICCAAYPNLEGKNVMTWIIIIGIILGCCIGPAISSSSSKSSSNTSKPGTSYSTTTTSYTITFNKDGGSGGSSSVSAKKGQSMPYATAPTKKGYTFGGYFTSRNGQGTKYYSASMSSSRSWDKTTNVTLYAYWIEDDNGIKLTSSNFQQYFTITVRGSASNDSAKVTYSIAPKSSSLSYSTKSDNMITVTVRIGFYHNQYTTYYTLYEDVYVTLYKSSGYKTSGTISARLNSLYSQYYVGATVQSCSGTIYK